jgi:hypothetical protein
MYLGAFTVMVVQETPNSHPSGMLDFGKTLNCRHGQLFSFTTLNA